MSTTIEATCTTCGTVNRVGDADVPAGAKFVSCISCKSRVALPPMKASRAAAPPPVPKGGSEIGLADLPAPKRQSPLGNAGPSMPAPRSALADVDLPAPRGARPSQPPMNQTASGTFDLDALMPADDAGLPAPKSRAADVADLPAPRGAPKPRALSDLPGPDVSDLPAPSARPSQRHAAAPIPSVADLPQPKSRQPSVSDLPAPVSRGAGIVDLPTPARGGGVVDLPTPARGGGVVDLPTPSRGAPGIVDLPTPARGVADLPTPRADVPAPKGFFDDLPQPSRNQPSPTKNPDLPAPKGFFDDLPGKVSNNKPDVPAPKGFFDDLPGRQSSGKAAAAATPEVPAPKGFFDDLPGRPNASAPQPPAPKGFFEDLPGRPNSTTNAPQPPAPKGFFDDLPQPALASTPSPPVRNEKPSNSPIELSMDSAAQPLDLGLAGDEQSQSRRYDDLDLSAPSTGINIAKSAPGDARAKAPSIQPLPSFRDQGQPSTLELEEPRPVAQTPTPKLGAKRKSDTVDPEAARAKAKRMRILALAGLLVVILGGVGFYVYSRWAAKKAVENTIAEELAKAKAELGKSDAAHWDRASAAAALVIDANNQHAEALAISAEARLASALANGRDYQSKVSGARAAITKAVAENIAGPNLIRAQALNAITNGIGDRALELLKPQVPPESKDAALLLYLGWAYQTAGDAANALKTFDAAIANGTDYLKVCALYGRGQVKLEQGDLDGANADFKAVLEIDKEHVGAQVWQAAAMPASQAQQQEKNLLALFERKDFATSDPRAVVKAWSLAAEAAKRGGRLDAARERYRNAMQIMPDDLGVLAGAAEVELRDGKLDAATELISKALNISKDDVRSQLVQSEISVQKKDFPDARARLNALDTRNPPPSRLDQSRIKLALGKLADADGKDDEAIELYAKAAELAGDADLTPTLTAVNKYSSMADKSEDQEKKGPELRGKASALLEKLEKQAEKDPAIALALGTAYLRTGDPVKAEPWLYKFVEARPDDAEGHFQLAKALARQDKTGDAVTRLTRAIELAPKRFEFQVELARTYERANEDQMAGAIYNRLLADAKDAASVELRAAAGRFFARRGEKEKAGEQGELILKVVPNHTTGMFLKAEGLLARNNIDDARILFLKAATTERDALYSDGVGRSFEAKSLQSKELKFQDTALEHYRIASQINPKMLSPYLGMGRIYVARAEYKNAIEVLLKANAIDPKSADVMYLVGFSFFQQKEAGQAANAMRWLGDSVAIKPNGEAYYYLGVLYAEANQGNKAADYLDKATKVAFADERAGKPPTPWTMDALYKLGEVQKQIGNYPGAYEAWTAWKLRNPPQGPRLTSVLNDLATTLKPR